MTVWLPDVTVNETVFDPILVNLPVITCEDPEIPSEPDQ